ncbi:hypothetical protein ABW19_dt0201539 [Dactylella cylindrospora]|nr:hypothetical protein ABW19_dt0201539 [Dactylella cylindrospora]
MAGLQHAPLLTDLHIEDCHVTYAALDKLLVHALPVLQRLVLRVPYTSRFAQHARTNMNMRHIPDDNPHLCQHFRRGGKNLKHFEFTAPFICRDLFVDEYEKAKLRESGHPGTLAGDHNGTIAAGDLDILLITGILKNARLHRATDSIAHAPKPSEGTSFEEDKKIVEKERLLRNRRFKVEKERWTRKIHVLEGMCTDGDTFDELPALAEVEEEGITWFFGHLPSKKASKVMNGMMREISYAGEFEREQPMIRRTQTLEHDTNDDLMGH